MDRPRRRRPPYCRRVRDTAAIRLVTWGNAWLTGGAALDDVVGGVRGGDVSHTFAFPDPTGDPGAHARAGGLPGISGSVPGFGRSAVGGGVPAVVTDALPVALALGELRRRGATAFHLALPVPGDPVGLVAPSATLAAAVEAEQAAVVAGTGLALVPELVGAGMQWTAMPAQPPPAVTSRGQAEREMSEQLLAAARDLAALEVARWNPRLPELLAGLDAGQRVEELPDALDTRARGLVARATRLRAALVLALGEDGGARTAGESRRRRELLEPLERATRRAAVAACAPQHG